MAKRSLSLVIIGLVIGMVLGGGFLSLQSRPAQAPIRINTPVPTPTDSPTTTPEPIQIYVNGAVNAPDVYSLPADSRVKQAIEAAGGFSEQANTAVVNLAQPLVDGAHIYVPDVVEGTAEPGQVISVPSEPVRSVTIGTGGILIDINTAGVDELEELPGIGPVIAQKIIDYRTANGSFDHIQAIKDVPGIGDAKFEAIRELITTGR